MIAAGLTLRDQLAGGRQIAQVGAMKRVLHFQVRRWGQIEYVQIDFGRRKRAAHPAADKATAAGDQALAYDAKMPNSPEPRPELSSRRSQARAGETR